MCGMTSRSGGEAIVDERFYLYILLYTGLTDCTKWLIVRLVSGSATRDGALIPEFFRH